MKGWRGRGIAHEGEGELEMKGWRGRGNGDEGVMGKGKWRWSGEGEGEGEMKGSGIRGDKLTYIFQYLIPSVSSLSCNAFIIASCSCIEIFHNTLLVGLPLYLDSLIFVASIKCE